MMPCTTKKQEWPFYTKPFLEPHEKVERMRKFIETLHERQKKREQELCQRTPPNIPFVDPAPRANNRLGALFAMYAEQCTDSYRRGVNQHPIARFSRLTPITTILMMFNRIKTAKKDRKRPDKNGRETKSPPRNSLPKLSGNKPSLTKVSWK